MGEHIKINFDVLDEYFEKKCGGKEYFLGGWSVDPINLSMNNLSDNIQIEHGKNWFVLRNGADVVDGLIFPKENIEDPEAIVFRGYLAQASIHTYSPAEKIKKYYSKDMLRRHNGIFSAVKISEEGKKIELLTDILGIGPLYYRKVGTLVLFSSSPGLLSLKDDEPDMMSWFLRIRTEYIPGRKSLIKNVEVVPEASVMTFSDQGQVIQKWYDYNNFPRGNEEASERSVDLSEEHFIVAMKRCQEIQFHKTFLPLSSGYDSKRILAHLMKNETEFEAFTVQAPEKTGEDIDAVCVRKIVEDFEIKHHMFNFPSPEDWHKNNVQRIFSVDGHCQFHTWSVPVFNYYGSQNGCFYDGLGGDTFNFMGWIFRNHVEKEIPTAFPKFLRKNRFPSYHSIATKLRDMKSRQPKGKNQSILTFALWQTRKSTSLWIQQQARPGHIILCPYLDLDYVETMMRFSVEDNVEGRPQKAILYKYWPKLAQYPGTRERPEHVVDISDLEKENDRLATKKLLGLSFTVKTDKYHYQHILTFFANILLLVSQYFNVPGVRSEWWIKQVSELVFWWQSRPIVIELRDVKNKK